MTMIEEAPQPTLEDDFRNTPLDPAVMLPENVEEICNGLEALFRLPDAEEKRDFPHEVSALIKSVFGDRDRMTFVVNAGDGSILTAFDPAYCFGIEPEDKRSRTRQGRYHSIVGTLPRVSKLLEPLGTELEDTIVILREDTDIEETLDFLNANLSEDTFVAYVDTTGDGHAATLTTHSGVYADVCVQELDIRIYFAGDTKRLKGERKETASRVATLDMIDLLGGWLQQQLDGSYWQHNQNRQTGYAKGYESTWRAIHREYGRRFVREDQTYDIELVGKSVLNYLPSEWCKLAIESQPGSLGDLTARIHRRNVTFFAQHSGLWRELLIMEDEGIVLIDPTVKERVAPVIEDAERTTTPLRKLKIQERLGYLGRASKIKCSADDEEAGFIAGKWYGLRLQQQEYAKKFTKNETYKGVLQLARKKRRYMHQRIIIHGHSYYDDDPNDIEYLLKHFELPDVPDIRTRYPELVAAEQARYDEIEAEYLGLRGFAFRPYQKTDLAAISVNDRAVLAHQQGLGKSIEGLAFALNAQKKSDKDLPVLLICPQDLIPQWQAEAKEKYGIDLHWIGRHKGKNGNGGKEVQLPDGKTANIANGAIKNLIEARDIARKIAKGGGGFYITHFEALTSGGARNIMKVEEPYVLRIEKEQKFVRGGYRTDEDGRRRWFDSEYQEVEHEVTTAHECPECGNQLFGRLVCNPGHRRIRKNKRDKSVLCGWSRYTYRLPTIGQILSTTFRKGVIIVDEGTQIASARNSSEKNSSQKTKAVCGMRAHYRLVMSGTPVKNFIAQAFWLLWWAIGNKSKRFPYAYNGGKAEFAKDYTVLEWTYNDETGNWANVKEVGEVTNHTRLWAQLAATLLRRVKEETGELIPRKEVHVLHTPLGYYQREQMDSWLSNFPAFFAEKYPQDPKVKRGSHVHMAAMLGLDVKLNYASVLPKTDKDWAWTEVPVSNYTPAAYKALTTIMALVKQGRRVLVGTDIKAASGWLASQLADKGIPARTMLNPNGSGDTLDPQDRAKVVKEFQDGAMAVLVSTQKAIRLGHNLDKGSAVVLLGLDWDYETFAQFTERVHRLTSIRPIDIYVVISGEENRTMLGRKWDVIQDKAKGASMALDGQLPEQNEEPPDIGAIVAEMVKDGIPAVGTEVLESKVKAAWEQVPHIDEFEIPEGFADNQAQPWIIDWDAANAAYEQHLAVLEEYRVMWLPDPDGVAEFTEALQKVVDEAVIDGLDAFFNMGTAELEEVPNVTNSGGREILPPSETEEPSSADEQPAELSGDGVTDAPGESRTPSETELVEPEGQEAGSANSSASADLHPAPPPSLDYMGQLKQAKELFDLGVLSDDEFNTLKAELLAGLRAAA